MTTRPSPICPTCGNDRDECNPEVHAAEMRASANDYYETGGFPERDHYDGDPGPDATCVRCGDVGVEWNVEIQDAHGAWVTICTTCERPEDWVAAAADAAGSF